MRSPRRRSSSEGFALVMALLLLLLLSALAVGMVYMVGTESRLGSTDRENTLAYYGSEAAMEKLTADIAALYATQQTPTKAALENLGTTTPRPDLPGVTYPEHTVTVLTDARGNPVIQQRMLSSGAHQGLMALVTPMALNVTARRPGGAEVRMSRDIEVALIPIFQFGVFSETDLGYFGAPPFAFAGRVHTNGNLFLASHSSFGLLFRSRLTAVGEVVRRRQPNGFPANDYVAPLKIPTRDGGCNTAGIQDNFDTAGCRRIRLNEGSVLDGLGSAVNEPTWSDVSNNIYNGNLLNGRTGARALNLPFVRPGLQPIEIIRRPPAGEDPNSPVGQDRFYNKAHMRVTLNDTQTGLPGGTGGVQLANGTPYFTGTTYGATNTPFAESPGGGDFFSPAGTALIDGWLKVEARQSGAWRDVTLEWLNLGIAAPSPNANPNPNAILHFQRLADNDLDANGNADNPTTTTGAASRTNYHPINICDLRESQIRDIQEPDCALGGVINIVELNVNNLRRWLAGQIGTSGTTTDSLTQGYIVYFSDRRGNHSDGNLANAASETGEYGFEDVINQPSANYGSVPPNGNLEPWEDVNDNGTLETYGQTTLGFCPAGLCTYPLGSNPTARIPVNNARKNRVIGFRRALRLVNGALGQLPVPGFTVGSENPVYIQGNYNADNSGFGDPHAAAAVIADAVTLLSNAWRDRNSWTTPTNFADRVAAPTWYRVAIIGGKNRSYPYPGTGIRWIGTDGGVHNFLRYLEDWRNGAVDSWYHGSIISLWWARQAVGAFKCCNTVYRPPQRNYSFDTEFLNPNLLPPGTPMFRDIVNLGFREVFRAD